MRRALKSLLPNLAVSAVCCLLGLAGLEYAARLLYPAYDPAGRIRFERNPDQVPLAPAGFVGRQWTNTGEYDVGVRINRFGFRDDNDVTEATENDFFALGDSYTFGHGVEERERFSDIVEHLLGKTVYNIASPTDFDGYYRILEYTRSLGAPVRHLIIGVCMENDLGRYGSGPPVIAGDGVGFETVSPGWIQQIKEQLTARSCLYSVVTAQVQRSAVLRTVFARLRLLNDAHGSVTKHVYSPPMINSSADRLAEIAGSLDSWIVIIPSRMLWTGGNQKQEDRVHRAFVLALKRRGLRVIDLRPHWERTGAPLALHFPLNGHWNVRGHALAGRIIADEMARNLGVSDGNGPAGRD